MAQRFIVAPFRRDDKTTIEQNKTQFLNAIEACVYDRLSCIGFEPAYRSGYNLNTQNQGVWVLDEASKALRRLNLRPIDDTRYYQLAKAIADICLFPNKSLATREGIETTSAAAERLRNMRGLQLWRILVTKWAAGLARVALWQQRIASWRFAFNNVCYAPGNSGAKRAKLDFVSLASVNDVTN